MVLAAYILLIAIVSLLTTRATPEIWGYYLVEDGGSFPITHWENVIGRSKSADLNIPLVTVSNNQAILSRYDDDHWLLKDLESENGTFVNGQQLDSDKRYLIEPGDEIVIDALRVAAGEQHIGLAEHRRRLRQFFWPLPSSRP